MSLWFDLKYAWRLMRKSWGHSLTCASVVALSVGLAVWTWTLVYSQLFEPFPFAGSERWYSVQLAPDATSRARPVVDAWTWQEILKRNRTADYLGAFATRAAVLSEGEATTSLRATEISPRLLAAAHVPPLLGRTFTAADAQPGAAAVAIISFDTWQQYFAAAPSIVGRTARIDAAPVQIVGVMPKDFLMFDDFELFMPLRLPVMAAPGESTMTLSPLLLLRDEGSLSAILKEINTAVASANAEHPELFNSGRHAALIRGSRMFTHGVTPIVTMIGLMAAGVLLLGCVNISMVFLARLLERSRELALRTALGASRPRLLRQCLLETALIVLLGLAGGIALAFMGVEWTHGISEFGQRVLASGRSTNVPTLRPADLVMAVLFALAVWLLSTLLPAWRVARQDAAVVLAGSGKGTNVRGSNRSVSLLVGLQVIISCLVLVTCGNVVLGIRKEVSKPTGLDTAGVLFSTYPTAFDARFSEGSQRVTYWEELSAAVANRLPGATVAFTTAPPTRPARVSASIETRQRSDKEGALTLPLSVVSENYFDLLGIRLRSGRLFDRTDNADSLEVAIVDERMAARFWPDQEALGKRVEVIASDRRTWLTIVGVVSNVAGVPYRKEADLGALYRPIRQAVPSEFHVLVRTPRGDGDSRRVLRAAAFAVDRDLPLHNLQPLDDYRKAVYLSYPAMTKVFIAIAIITAVLAASGLFGLISRSVAQRTQEVGIRRALGATPWRAASMFLRQGALYLVVAFVGLGLGILLLPMLSRAIPNILDHVVPVTLGVILLIAAVVSVSSYLPTRRAVALEPGDALRYE